MALVLGKTPPSSNGKEVLNASLDAFCSILTDEERRKFDEICLSQPSDHSANRVMALIYEIDRRNSKRFSRCVGPKLLHFLVGVQQFSGIVDTLMTAGPPIAQLVWGSVKATLLILSHFSDYFGKLVALFDGIGKRCPRLRAFGSLYESSSHLQDVLCRYFAGVIDLCGKALKVPCRPGIVQFSIAAFKPFECEFGNIQDNLNQIAEEIKEEISLASSKVQIQESRLNALERKKDAKFRTRMTKFTSRTAEELADIHALEVQAEKRRIQGCRQAIKDNLCLLDQTKAWQQARKQCLTGTATWFEQNEGFCQWLERKRSSTIWYSGKMGSGKTILTASVIAHLTLLNSPPCLVSYFFCQHENSETLSASNIIGSIARQMLGSIIDNATGDELDPLVAKTRSLEPQEKAKLIFSVGSLSGTNFVVLDGLDRCETSEVDIVLDSLKLLIQKPPSDVCLKLFVSSGMEISNRLNTILKPKFRLIPTSEDLDEDISMYISAALDNSLESGKLQLNDPELILPIQKALLIGAQGMFLWATLLLEYLCLQNSDRDMITALQNVPPRLSSVFDRLLEHALRDEVNSKTLIQVLKWTVGALRPLNVEELRQALTVRPGQTSFDFLSLPKDLSTPIFNCHGLIVVDEDDSTVHLVHHSLKQYLLSKAANKTLASCHFEQSSLDDDIAICCMTYLSFNDFKYILAKAPTESSKLASPSKMASEVTGLKTETIDKIVKARSLLSGSGRKRSGKIQDQTTDMVRKELEKLSMKSMSSSSKQQTMEFLEYARTYWIYHTKNLQPEQPSDAWNMFCKLIDLDGSEETNHKRLAETPWTVAEWSSRRRKISQWIGDHNHLAAFSFIQSQSGKPFPETEVEYLILKAAKKELVRMLEIVLPSLAKNRRRVSDLIPVAAAEEGSLQGLEKLLEVEADVNAATTDDCRGLALQAAAGSGHLDVVERLLMANADVNAVAGGQTALEVAARGGHLGVVERLLMANADVNAVARGWTALEAAAVEGHLNVVERLLMANADVNAAPGGWTALYAAARGGYLDVVERLLMANADVNAVAGGRTALQAAAREGHLDVVERLLSVNADVNPATGGWTALHAAEVRGHLDVVERLKKAGAIH